MPSLHRTPARNSLFQRVGALCARRRWSMLGVWLLVVIAGMAVTLVRPTVYRATATILVTPHAGSNANGNTAATRRQFVRSQAEILASPALHQDALDDLAWKHAKRDFGGATLPTWAVSVHPDRHTDIIRVTARAYHPTAAAALANNIVRVYLAQNTDEKLRSLRQQRRFLESTLAESDANMKQANDALAQFKQKTGLIAPDAQVRKTAEYLATLQAERDAAITQISSDQQSLNLLREKLHAEKPSQLDTTTFTHDPRYNTLLEQLNGLHTQRAALLADPANAEKVKDLDTQITTLETRFKEIANTTNIASQTESRNPIYIELAKEYLSRLANQAAASARVTALSNALLTRQAEAAALPEKERQYAVLLQRATALRSTNAELQAQLHALQISEQGTVPDAAFLVRAQTDTTSKHLRLLQHLGLYLLLGMLAAVIVGGVAERRDDRLYDLESVETVTGLSILTTIPQVADGDCFIHREHCPPGLLESVRVLQNTFAYLAADNALKRVAVFSATSGEGRSTTCRNLAAALALEGARVTLVEMPTSAQPLNSDVPGVTDLLHGDITVTEAVRATDIDGVSTISAGTRSEMLTVRHCRPFLDELDQLGDTVLLDCPPCTALSDTQVIARLVNGIILVVSIGQTRRGELTATLAKLAPIKPPFIGVVVNRMPLGK